MCVYFSLPRSFGGVLDSSELSTPVIANAFFNNFSGRVANHLLSLLAAELDKVRYSVVIPIVCGDWHSCVHVLRMQLSDQPEPDAVDPEAAAGGLPDVRPPPPQAITVEMAKASIIRWWDKYYVETEQGIFYTLKHILASASSPTTLAGVRADVAARDQEKKVDNASESSFFSVVLVVIKLIPATMFPHWQPYEGPPVVKVFLEEDGAAFPAQVLAVVTCTHPHTGKNEDIALVQYFDYVFKSRNEKVCPGLFLLCVPA